MERLPCLTTGRPQAAASSAAPVDRFKLPDESPPVPTISMASASRGKRRLARERAHGAGESAHLGGVTPLARSADEQRAGHGGSEIARRQHLEQRAASSFAEIAALQQLLEGLPGSSASRAVRYSLQEIAHQDRTFRREHAFRMELHSLDRQRLDGAPP